MLSGDPEICEYMFEQVDVDGIILLTNSENGDVQHRVCAILKNAASIPSHKLAKLFIEKQCPIFLLNVSKNSNSVTARRLAMETLELLNNVDKK